MLEAKLNEAVILKKLLDSIRELVQDAEFKCNEEAIVLQAMDNSHVALVSVKLDASSFRRYRCDRPIPLGVNLNSLTKVLKCAKDDDICTLKATDDSDVLSLTYEARNADRIAEYEMKLMDIDADTLGIPDTDYEARVTMPSSEFARIVRDLSNLGESVRIEVSKEGVRFAADGESANGSILLKQTESARKKYENYNDEEVKEEGDGEEGESKKKKRKVKKEPVEDDDEEEENKKAADEDEPMDEDGDEGEFKVKSDDEGEDEQSESESKKRKKAPSANGKPKKRAKKGEESEGPVTGVDINMTAHVSLTFSLKYLVNFSKSSALSDTVQLMLRNDVPLLVSYMFGQGHIRYYLAPKIGDD